jgi:copper(I)-binding protein
MRRRAALLVALLLAGCTYYPTIPDVGGIRIRPQNGRAVVRPAGLAVFVDLASTGKYGDTLVGASSDVAKTAALVVPGAPKATGVEIPGATTVSLAPEGAHIVLTDLTRPVKPGDVVLVTLLFERLGRIGVPARVESPARALQQTFARSAHVVRDRHRARGPPSLPPGSLEPRSSLTRRSRVMKRLVLGLATTCLVAALAAPAHADVRRAFLDSFQENPDIFSAARGDFTAIIARDETRIDFELNYENLEGGAPTVAHIHLGKRGVNGGVMVFLCGGGGMPACPAATSGQVVGTITPAHILSIAAQGTTAGALDEVIFALRRGHAYVNVHNATFPSGEIRGQVR